MLLSIQDLSVQFRMGRKDGAMQYAQAVGRGAQTISFDIPENSTVALVGESGSGKSVTAMSILNLLPDNAQRSGRIMWYGAPTTASTPSTPQGGEPILRRPGDRQGQNLV